ncbi:MAG: hypothetical protein WBB28_15685, partial [Crinalium sp.]
YRGNHRGIAQNSALIILLYAKSTRTSIGATTGGLPLLRGIYISGFSPKKKEEAISLLYNFAPKGY